MKKDRICKYCRSSFENIEGRIFSNHVRWCISNPNDTNKNHNNGIDNKLGKLKDFIVECKKCKKEFSTTERSKQFPKKDNYYCSRSCANSRGVRSEETKDKIRLKLQNNDNKKKIQRMNCLYCGGKVKRIKQKYCSRICSGKSKRSLDDGSLKIYRRRCAFNFSLNDFPEEFNFTLIEKYGWYKPANAGNNLNGVSRDHIVSVKFGFENNIDPKIISHPANCQLMRHSDNVSKYDSCGASIKELIKLINIWDKKYTKK